MNISGQLIIKRLERALAKVREKASDAETSMRAMETRSGELLEKRGKTILDLAKHYLPDLNRETIQKTFTEVQDNLLQIVERKERRHEQIKGRYGRLLKRQADVENRKSDLANEIEERANALESKEKAVAEALKLNETFQKLSKTALQAEERLTRNEARLEEIAQEAKEKLPDYRKSSLFQYLLQRDFGTSKYESKGWRRRWDRWVARKIDFGLLKQSYSFLKTTPKLMKEEIERRKTDFNDLMEQIENFQKLEADQQGIPELISENEKIQEQFEDAVKEWERIAEDLVMLDREFKELEQSEESFYGEAVDRFQSFLVKTEVEVLEARAKQTEQRTDDRLVEDIRWFSQQIDELQPQLKQTQRTRSRLSDEIKGLDFVLRRSSQSEMVTERCEFEKGFDVKELIQQHSQQVLDKEQFWKTLKGRMVLKPNWASKTKEGIDDVLNSSSSRMLGDALTGVATTALKAAVRRGLLRRR